MFIRNSYKYVEETMTYFKARYVDHAKDPGKDNIIIIVRKHTISANDEYCDLRYCVSAIQRRKMYVKLRWLNWHFPDRGVFAEIDSSNSLHAFNRFDEKGHVGQKYNNCRLIDLTREELHTMRVPVILGVDDEFWDINFHDTWGSWKNGLSTYRIIFLYQPYP